MSVGVSKTHPWQTVALEEQVADVRRPAHEPQPQRGFAPPQNAVALAAELGLEHHLHRICQLTESMFPGEITVEVISDPECPQDRFIVFDVTAAGDLPALVDRQCQWHEEVFRRAPDALNLFRISIAPR